MGLKREVKSDAVAETGKSGTSAAPPAEAATQSVAAESDAAKPATVGTSAVESAAVVPPAADPAKPALIVSGTRKYKAAKLKIRDPHSGLMFYTNRDTPSEVTDWVTSQVESGVLVLVA